MNTLSGLTTGYAPVHNGNLYYEVAGSGQALLFIHAGIADCQMWDAQMAFFSQDNKVIRYDARGYGKSNTETTQFSNRQDILDLLNFLGVDKVCVIGLSRGGQIAIDFTIEHPEHVSALVAAAAGISGYQYDADNDPQALGEVKLFEKMDELWEKKAWDQLTDLQVHVWGDGPAQPEGRVSPEIRSYLQKVIRAGFDRQDGEATPIPLSPLAINRLEEIRLPTLIVIGEYDACDALAAADELECRIPRNRKVGVPGVAHMIPMERPDVFNEVVHSFLKEEL